MQVGDLVVIRNARSKDLQRTGFIIKIQDRHNDGVMFCFVRFPSDGRGWWYHPSKVKVLSEK